MSYERSKHYREYALIEGIHLLVNMVDQIKKDKTELEQVLIYWQTFQRLGLVSQFRIISGTSADDKACEYLVDCLNDLNDEIMSEFPYGEWMKKLTSRCLGAMTRAYKAHSHIWNDAQLQSIRAAFGSAHVAKTLPYYVPPDKDEKEIEIKKKRKYEVI